jgi:hypothetical protein
MLLMLILIVLDVKFEGEKNIRRDVELCWSFQILLCLAKQCICAAEM